MPEIVFISGCSSGIGLATAVLLANDPQKRYIVYASIVKPVSEETEFITAVGDALNDSLFAVQMDVTNEQMVKDAVAMVMTAHGHIDILINIAGVNLRNVSEAISLDVIKRVFDINFFGMVRVTQEVLPVMKRRRSGRIINMGSMHGIVAFPYMGLYGASKQAIVAFSQETAIIGRFFNIRVSVVEPGAVNTAINAHMVAQGFGGWDDIQGNPNVNDLDRTLSKCHYTNLYHEALLSPANAQNPSDIADLILHIMTEEKPHFRYQTSEACRSLADQFYKDVTGDSFIDSQVAELHAFKSKLEKECAK